MPCEVFRSYGADGKQDGTGIVCTSRRRSRAVCVVCRRPGADRLCDGRDPGAGKTCDAPLHASCSTHVPKPRQEELLQVPRVELVGDDWIDLCPRHARGEQESDMKALTLTAPWGWAIAIGAKRVENRDWLPTPAELRPGELLAIHQGKTYDDEAAAWIRDRFPLLKVPTKEEMTAAGQLGAFLGVARYLGAVQDPEDLFPDVAQLWWFMGPNGWRLQLVVSFLGEPLPARGFQKLWNVKASDRDVLLRDAGKR